MLMSQAGDDRLEEINPAVPLDACGAKLFGHEFEKSSGWFHRCIRRFEAGNGSLEEQLMMNSLLA